MVKQLVEDASEVAAPSREIDNSGASVAQPTPTGPVPTEVQINDSSAVVCYANFCCVTGTPEELILDFGLNAQPAGSATCVEINQRLIVNFFTAKRLNHALGLSIQGHEHAFGVLETDVQKRVTPALRRAASAG